MRRVSLTCSDFNIMSVYNRNKCTRQFYVSYEFIFGSPWEYVMAL